MNLVTAISKLVRTGYYVSQSHIFIDGDKECRQLFLVNDINTHVELFAVDDRLVSVSFTTGFFYKKYSVSDSESFKKAIADYKEELNLA